METIINIEVKNSKFPIPPNLYLIYDESGRLQGVRNAKMEHLMMSYVQEGMGYEWSEPHAFGVVNEKQCDVRFVYLPAYEIYIPMWLFVYPEKL